ncbi:MAG TPA: hypothetical protein VGF12_01695 [Roseateles sp.]
MYSAVIHASLFIVFLLAASAARAWGVSGHRIVAELAYEVLPTATRTKVQELLELEPGATLSSISTWPCRAAFNDVSLFSANVSSYTTIVEHSITLSAR